MRVKTRFDLEKDVVFSDDLLATQMLYWPRQPSVGSLELNLPLAVATVSLLRFCTARVESQMLEKKEGRTP